MSSYLVNLTEEQVVAIEKSCIDLNGYFLLERIGSQGNLPRKLLDIPKMSWAYAFMERVGYIKDEKITELGKIVLDTIRSCGADESFTDKFRAIFPSIKLPTGKNFRSNPVDIAKRLKLFSKEYSYSPETILEAAREYVRHAERENYKYIRTASYFIYKKDEGSDLASWCEKVLAEHKERTPEPQQKFV